MHQVVESIHPHVGEYFLYEGKYHIPKGFSFEVKDDSIIIRHNRKYKKDDYIHSLYTDYSGNTKKVIGQINEIFDNCYVLLGYCTIGNITFHPEQIIVHIAATRPAEDWEIDMYNNSITEYKRDYKNLIEKLCIK